MKDKEKIKLLLNTKMKNGEYLQKIEEIIKETEPDIIIHKEGR